MSVLKLSKNDIIRNDAKEEKIKLKRSNLSFDSAVISGWEQSNRESLNILNDYNNRINKSEWLDEEERKKYRTALDAYISTANSLRSINKNFGEGYSDEDEQNWTNSISSLNKGYDDISRFYSQFADDREYNNWYLKETKRKEYESAQTVEDFDEYSNLGANVANPSWEAAHAPLDIAGWKPFGDGETINNMVTFAEAHGKDALRSSNQALADGGTSTYGEIVSLINEHMKDDEKAIYNYYVGKGDTEKANEYLTYITDILRQRQAGKITSQVDNTALEAVFSLGAGVQNGITGLENLIKLAVGADPIPTSTMQYAHGSMSQNNEGVWKAANDLLYTTGNMTPSILAGTIAGPLAGPMVGKAVGSLVTTLSSAGNSYASMIEEGYGVDEARKYGVMVGITEGALSYAFSGISSIGGRVTGNIVSKAVDGIDNGIARFVADVALNMGSEALEEATQEVLDPVFKMIATGEDFEGIDWSNVAYSALLGGLSAGLLEGVPRGASAIHSNYQTNVQMGGLSNKGAVNAFFKGNENGTKGFKGVAEAYKSGKQTVNEMASARVNEALDIDPDNKFAQKMQTRLDKGKNASGYQINRLIESNENALVSQDKGKMKSAVESRLTELGESGDVSAIAEAIVKSELGEKLTKAERQLLESENASWVAEELSTDSPLKNEGEYSNWAESLGTERINTEAYNRAVTDYAGEATLEPTKSNAVTENATSEENAVESEISAPVEGVKSVAKAKMTDAEGNEVEVKPQRFATTDGGEMGVEIEDGKVVAASEVDFGESDIGLVRQAAVDMSSRVGGFSVDTANVFVNGYNEATGQSAGAYIDGWISAYKFGAMKNPPPLSALAANPKTAQLTEEQRKNAYNFGRVFGNEAVAEKQAKIDSTVSINTGKDSQNATKTTQKGRVIFDGKVYGKNLNERQRASLKALNFISKALGKDIYVEKLGKGDNGWYDPTDRSIHVDLYAGVEAEALMLFTVSHELTHDIRATLPEKFNALADAVFEEYTKRYDDHTMEDLIDAKIDFLKEKGDITEDMTEEEAYDLAYEEVICDCLETMLVDSDAIEALSKNIYAKDKGLWERIKDFFVRLVARIKAAYADVIPDSEEGQRFRDLGEGAERIKKLWVEAIVELSELGSDAKTDSGDVVNVIEDGQFYKVRGEDAVRLSREVELTLTQETVNGKKVPMVGFPLRYFDTYAKKAADKGITLEKVTVKHSYSSIAYSFFGDKKVTVKDFENGSYTKTEGYKRYVENCLNNMRQTSESFNEEEARKEIEDSIGGIVKVAVAMKKAGYDILDNHAKRSAVDSKNRLLFSSLEPNSDYFTSSDISTICDKRINFAEIYDEIVRREEALGVPKGKRFFDNVDNYFILHKIMADKGLTQPCRQCYVESMRKNLAPMANAFLELMQETDPDNKANKQLYQPSGKSKGELKSNNAKLRENLLETIAEEEYTITANDLTVEMLTTEDGLAQLKLQAPLIYEAFNSFYGQSKPKMPKSATPFRFGELTAMLTDNKGKIKKSLIDKIMSTGGFRLQSYSDFQIQNFADVLQVIFEAGTLGLSGHAYTKVPAFLDATKGTNLKRNISIFMYNDNGEWKIDRNDSFPYDLDKIYDIVNSDKQGNTSIIAVSQNEMMSAFIMANDNIGYFIPFHKSGMKMGTVRETIVKEGGREIKGYSGIKDHTRQQTEVWAKNTADHKANTKVKKGINIYEFWDFDNADNLSREGLIEKNVRAYIDACNEAGYLPKFREYVMNNSKVLNAVLNYSKQLGFVSQNATIDDISFKYNGYRIPYGYYKCLGDFGMFTPDGEASPIERLSLKDYDFDEAEAFFSNAESLRRTEILQQIANGEERERYRNSDMTTAEIAEEVQAKRNQVVEEVVSGEYKKVKHSHKASEKATYADSVYLDAVNRGDMETAQRMVDEAAKAAGYTESVFHGTRSGDFYVFDEERIGDNYGGYNAEGGAFDFTYDESRAWLWAGKAKGLGKTRVVKAFIKSEKPFYSYDGAVAKELFDLLPDNISEDEKKYAMSYGIPFKEVLEQHGIDFKKAITSKGFDSYKMYRGDLGNIGVYSPYQIKSADPVTYDDDGNVIPLSERFNSKNSDIRYQHQPSNSMKPRTLLANALETTAQNDIERQKLAQYKEKIELLNAEEQKLHELREQIKELSVKKGTRDTQAIKKLQFEANQAANRINTYDRQLFNLESTKALKGVLEREKAQARKRAEEKADQRRKEAVARVKESAAKTQQELMDRYQESRKRGVESRNKTAMRHKIKDVVNELNNYLLKGTKDKHVPIELQRAVAEALDAVNMDTVGAEEIISKLKAEMMRAKTPEAMQDLAKKIDHIEEKGGNMEAKISRLKTAYDSIINSEDPLIANSHDDVISSTIEKVMEITGETPLRDMSLYQLEAVYDMYRMVLHSVRSANKAFKAKKSEEISVIANRVMEEVDKLGKKKVLQTKAGQTISEFDWNNQKPVYAFERIGSDSFTEVFNNVRAGEDTWAVDMTEAQKFLEDQKQNHKFDSWDFDKKYEFTSSTGKNFKLSLGQIMSLYAYSKRGDQAKDHLRNGGFVFDGLTEVKEKNKLGVTKTYQLKDATAYNLSDETLSDILSKLTPEQKAFADAMQDYLSTVMGEKGNEVSLELYGVKLFKEKNYFPLKSASQYLERAREQAQGDTKIKNKGFTKETTPKAKNPIVLTSFMDVWAGHVNEMSMYHAFTLALEDFYRVFNYKTPASETMDSKSVISFLENAHGEASVSYIDQLLKDLNGGARSDPRESAAKALMSKFKKASFMASLSVVVQQPSAIVRAQALVDAKYFVGKKVSSTKHKETWEEVKKYAPVAVIKEMGYFDVGMGQSSIEWLTSEEYHGFKEKAKGLVKDGSYRDEVLSKLPALADEYTWCAIWNAVKRETAHNNPTLKTSSEEFLKLVGERFTEVIVKTQVYDSTLARSANMRSKSGLMSMWTAFMAEPTTSINMLQDAFKKGNKKMISRTIGAVYGSVVLNAALVSLVYAMRDDDEDETFLEKYLSRLTTEVIDGINPLTNVPFVKDIWSALQGFDIERSDMTLITRVIDSLQQLVKVAAKDTSDMDDAELKEHRKAVSEAILSITDNLASLTGVPVMNIRRDINGIINGFKTIKADIEGRETTAGSLGDNIREDVKDTIPVWGWFPDESKGDKLYDAIIKGDKAYEERLKSGYKNDTAINSAIRKALRENDPRIKEAAKAVIGGNGADYARIVNEMDKEGKFSRKIITGAIAAEVEKLQKAK